MKIGNTLRRSFNHSIDNTALEQRNLAASDKLCMNKYIPARKPIDKLVLDFDVPQELANALVGRTEDQTARNIDLMIEYIEYVVESLKAVYVG